MSRYRKIEVKTWTDERFRDLSPIQPSGQGLWFFLLTGPHTGPIPGLFRAGRAAMAEELDWDIEAFDKAFQEVFQKGMAKADFKARLVWLPNALKHNKPESPNVVRSWRVELDLLPECDLKNEAIARIRENLESIGQPYVQAFDEVLCGGSKKHSPKPSDKPSAKAMPNQEQEQEQELNTSPDGDVESDAGEQSSTALPRCPHAKLIEVFAEHLPMLPTPKTELWGGTRARDMRNRWKWVLTAKAQSGKRYAETEDEAVDFFVRFFGYVAKSDFLTGRNGKWAGCTLAWLMEEANFAKVMEGNFENAIKEAA